MSQPSPETKLLLGFQRWRWAIWLAASQSRRGRLVKWNATADKGLTPLRPQVLLKTAVKLPPTTAIELTAAAASPEAQAEA